MTVQQLGLYLREKLGWGAYRDVAFEASGEGVKISAPEVTHVFAERARRPVRATKRRAIIVAAVRLAVQVSATTKQRQAFARLLAAELRRIEEPRESSARRKPGHGLKHLAM